MANPYGYLNFKAPVNWQKMTKREKLQWLAKSLPVGYKLEMFQEPRGTRANKSLYFKSMVQQNRRKRHPQGKKPKQVVGDRFKLDIDRILGKPPVQPPQVQVNPWVINGGRIVEEARLRGEFVEYEEPIPDEEEF
jgi:hypothetical protein